MYFRHRKLLRGGIIVVFGSFTRFLVGFNRPKEMMSDIPKVLLLGDSIRMNYQPHVARLLDGRAHVVGPSDNCQYSGYTLASLDRWIGELGCPEIIHWNNGIHDAGRNPDRYVSSQS